MHTAHQRITQGRQSGRGNKHRAISQAQRAKKQGRTQHRTRASPGPYQPEQQKKAPAGPQQDRTNNAAVSSAQDTARAQAGWAPADASSSSQQQPAASSQQPAAAHHTTPAPTGAAPSSHAAKRLAAAAAAAPARAAAPAARPITADHVRWPPPTPAPRPHPGRCSCFISPLRVRWAFFPPALRSLPGRRYGWAPATGGAWPAPLARSAAACCRPAQLAGPFFFCARRLCVRQSARVARTRANCGGGGAAFQPWGKLAVVRVLLVCAPLLGEAGCCPGQASRKDGTRAGGARRRSL